MVLTIKVGIDWVDILWNTQLLRGRFHQRFRVRRCPSRSRNLKGPQFSICFDLFRMWIILETCEVTEFEEFCNFNCTFLISFRISTHKNHKTTSFYYHQVWPYLPSMRSPADFLRWLGGSWQADPVHFWRGVCSEGGQCVPAPWNLNHLKVDLKLKLILAIY